MRSTWARLVCISSASRAFVMPWRCISWPSCQAMTRVVAVACAASRIPSVSRKSSSVEPQWGLALRVTLGGFLRGLATLCSVITIDVYQIRYTRATPGRAPVEDAIATCRIGLPTRLGLVYRRDRRAAPCRESLPRGGDQEFVVALRPGDRAFGDAEHAPARQPRPPGADALAHASCTAGSRTTPLRPTASGPASNCGLISATAQAPGTHSASGAGSSVARPMKLASQTSASIGSGTVGGVEVAGVGLLVHHHARIGAQLPGKLAMPDIHRMHPRRAMRQQHIREAAGRGAHVQADTPRRRQGEMPQRVLQLDAAARHPGVVLATHLQRCGIRQEVARLGNPALAGKHFARQNQRLGARPAFGQAAVQQELIGTALPAHRSRSIATGARACHIRRRWWGIAGRAAGPSFRRECMMRVVLAQPRGFCAGVERAIEIVERALKKYGPPIYVRHEIVHNRHVVEDLRTRGAVFVDELDEIPPGATHRLLAPTASPSGSSNWPPSAACR